MYDLIIKGAAVLDGTGSDAFFADVAVKDGKIAKIGENLSGAKEIIDATGLTLSPGWIDSHSHSDTKFLTYPDMKEKVEQYNQLQEAMRAVDPENEYEVRRLKNLMTQKYLELLYTNPAGFTLTARMTTNYRCLKNIWRQRRNHRLPEWREFCKWIETLPYAKELICYEEKGEEEGK